eukprot:CAMPEP_0205917808 /NCGR_PEP_ID=MMETSP1325-20131115/9400_1 /ASSEMBLY_ACC=CAM_ASM_000708 /TAXON_ID=236786 /ORGANISM="Florenciella sp., Strain RCC1007" /LENGTH=129 /DNA_ID=CAMNT_0053285271 /DNA_START=479 /DNA_END=865 /DNA_ORIENTATION=-
MDREGVARERQAPPDADLLAVLALLLHRPLAVAPRDVLEQRVELRDCALPLLVQLEGPAGVIVDCPEPRAQVREDEGLLLLQRLAVERGVLGKVRDGDRGLDEALLAHVRDQVGDRNHQREPRDEHRYE